MTQTLIFFALGFFVLQPSSVGSTTFHDTITTSSNSFVVTHPVIHAVRSLCNASFMFEEFHVTHPGDWWVCYKRREREEKRKGGEKKKARGHNTCKEYERGGKSA